MLKELIAECTDYDYKVSVETKKPRSWLKTVSAFANGVGGSLFFGISDEGNVIGLKNIKEDSERISELIKTRVEPRPIFVLIPHQIDSTAILEIQIQPGTSTPYYYHSDGVTIAYIRSGNESIEAPTYILNELILRGTGQTFDGVLTGDSFSDYAFSFLKSKYLKKTQTRLNDRDFVSFGLMKNDHLTRAGLLLADENELLQSRLFCTRWNGINKVNEKVVIDDDEISGSIIKQLDAAFDFYKRNTKSAWHKEGEGTVNEPEYDDIAITEALVNAIIHRDYNIVGAETCLNIYDDRIEVTSPGMMFSGKKIPEVIDYPMESIRRNPVIADVFNRMNLMNRRGSGLSNITNRTNALFSDGRNHVTFASEDGFFTVRIENSKYKGNAAAASDNGEAVADMNRLLTLNEYAVYSKLKTNAKLSYDELSKEVEISRRTVARAIAALVEKGYIKRAGSANKGGYWIILK